MIFLCRTDHGAKVPKAAVSKNGSNLYSEEFTFMLCPIS
jgi:hypothetical protein